MTERIIIKKFSCIDNLNAEFKQINIFIGPQASGKSITVKLLFFFKNQKLSLIFDKRYAACFSDLKKPLFVLSKLLNDKTRSTFFVAILLTF